MSALGCELPAYSRRVFYRDTDAGGVVYHAQYLVFFEEARAEWLRTLGIEQSAIWEASGLAYAVASLQIEYLRPARLDDALVIKGLVLRFGGATIELRQQVWRSSALLAEAILKLAYVDTRKQKIAPLPAVFRAFGRDLSECKHAARHTSTQLTKN